MTPSQAADEAQRILRGQSRSYVQSAYDFARFILNDYVAVAEERDRLKRRLQELETGTTLTILEEQ